MSAVFKKECPNVFQTHSLSVHLHEATANGPSRFMRYFFRVRRPIGDPYLTDWMLANMLFVPEEITPAGFKLHNDCLPVPIGNLIFSFGHMFKVVDNVVGSDDTVRTGFQETVDAYLFRREIEAKISKRLRRE